MGLLVTVKGTIKSPIPRAFGDLLVRAQRDNGKVLVRDVVRNVNLRIEREEERKRLRSLPFQQGQEPEIQRGQELKIAIGSRHEPMKFSRAMSSTRR